MKGFIFAGALMVLGSDAMAYVENFSGLIAQGYGDQAKTYERIQAEVESASKQDEVLEDLSKTSDAQEVDIHLITEKKAQRSAAGVETKERVSRHESIR